MPQWISICLPMQGTRLQSLVWEESTFHGQLIHGLDPKLRTRESHSGEKPRRSAPRTPALRNYRKTCAQHEGPVQSKMNK